MKISVVMTTYNGEKRLLTQLVSLRDQSRIPDEVLIFDDCSTDNSPEIVQNFIHENHLYNWTFIQNENNKGWRKNFADAINSSRGDVIFLCDQDDDWNLDKISLMMQVLETREDIDLLASNYHVIYEENARHIKYWMLKPYGRNHIEKVRLNGFTFEPVRPGCAYAFRKEMIPDFNRVWRETDAHDRVLWDIALVNEKLYILNEKLLNQIRYGNNQTPANQLGGSGRTDAIKDRRLFAERLLEVVENENSRQWLQNYIRIAVDRERNIQASSVAGLIKLAKNSDYLPLPVSWLIDIKAVLEDRLKKKTHK